jgi:hypothetical protein
MWHLLPAKEDWLGDETQGSKEAREGKAFTPAAVEP